MKKILRNIVVAVAAIAMMASCSLTLPVTATSNPVGSKVVLLLQQVFYMFYFLVRMLVFKLQLKMVIFLKSLL